MYVGPLRRGLNEAMARERRRVIAIAVLAGVAQGVSTALAEWFARVAGAPATGVARGGSVHISRKMMRQ